MVAILIARAELKMRIEKEPEIVLPLSQDNMLIARIARKNDLIGVDIVFRQAGDAFSVCSPDAQQHHDDHAKDLESAR